MRSTPPGKEIEKRTKAHNELQGKDKEIEDQKIMGAKSASMDNQIYQTSNRAWMSYVKAQEKMNLSIDEKGGVYWDNDSVKEMISENISRLDRVSKEYYELWDKYGEGAVTPSIAEPIQKYVSTALVDEAWRTGNYDVVKREVVKGWSGWYEDNSRDIVNVSEEKRNESLHDISKLLPNEEALNDENAPDSQNEDTSEETK